MKQQDPPWWHFWNPMSGLAGGMLGGLIIGLLILIVFS